MFSPDMKCISYYASCVNQSLLIEDKKLKVLNVMDKDLYVPIHETETHFKGIAVFAVPVAFIFPLIVPVVLFLAFFLYRIEVKSVSKRIKAKRERIENALPYEKTMFESLFPESEDLPKPLNLVKGAMDSLADTVIVPIQDYLMLGEQFRMNVPGVPEGNWGFRVSSDYISDRLKERILKIAQK